MNVNLTEEQRAAISSRGKVIVSASAGSGKTFVMIQKLADFVQEGGDLDEVLAVTFTKKAAAQMKEKLRSALIARLPSADEKQKSNIKVQLGKISSADISTIHSFCSHLVRTYFYALDVDSSFDIVAEDDALAMTMKNRALDSLFDSLYESDDPDFCTLLSCLKRKRSDENIRYLLLESHKSVRMLADYEEMLSTLGALYTEEGFERVCREYKEAINERCAVLLSSVEQFASSFSVSACGEKYAQIFTEMKQAVSSVMEEDLFAPLPKLYSTVKPRATAETAEASQAFAAFKDGLKEKFDTLKDGFKDRETEKKYFFESGRLTTAFARVLLRFDREYTAVKRDEGKLDYNDLEQLALALLKNGEIKSRVNAKYKYVFVDEYQDVNPVQEKIIGEVGAHNVFTVGDVKQAIYGFRGSKSLFFAQKYNRMLDGEGEALKLTGNFRSADGVLDFVNTLFSRVMVASVCGFDYKNGSEMRCVGGYPRNCGETTVHVFGKDTEQREEAEEVYSVAERSLKKSGHTREGLAVLEIVRRELSSRHFDLKKGEFVNTQAGDICILTRKRAGKSTAGIVRALTDAGYAVAGVKEANICDRPEVRQMLDILSYLDNCQQDIPLATALLSPLGGFTEDELAQIRIAQTPRYGEKPSFRECAVSYLSEHDDPLAQKISRFFKRILSYRRLSDILGAAKLIDKILYDGGLAARYAANGGEKLESIRRLAEEAYTPSGELHLNAFLNKIKAGGYKIKAPAASPSDSIKIMTMHASKGLEFPVVILSDAAASFKGREYSEMPFDDLFGFAPKYYESSSRLQYKTMLGRLCKLRYSREEIKNELNLFYVACTRAMCRLHIMTAEVKPRDPAAYFTAKCYADLCDFAAYNPEYMADIEDFDAESQRRIVMDAPDPALYEKISAHFGFSYAYADSVDLPVKSSASRLIRMNMEESYYAENEIFAEEEREISDGGEEEGGSASNRGTAYHRYLELCDFSVRDRAGVEMQLKNFAAQGFLLPEQAELLNVDHLVEILSMSVFDRLSGAKLYREREFLCVLPAYSFFPTSAEDGVLFQGAIDLLAIEGDGAAIIDYKYSHKSDAELVSVYAAQLALYKKAVAAILKIGEDRITTTIVNIRARREIPLST